MSTTQLHETGTDAIVRDAVTRSLAIVGLAAVALIHLLDAHDTFVETPYKGWLYVALIAACLGSAVTLARRNDRRAWWAALLLPLGAMLGFVYSRTVGLPGGADDIGNWWETLGLASLFVEGAVVVLSSAVLAAGAELTALAPEPRPAVRPKLQRSVR
ncbi:MAG TPA: hypothetical protein VH063_04680 [Gaiellaceae bacterium]|jgi:hypothetical protein|nr:hypothetical protein [Gaiellaceae bacterium]